MSTTNALLTNRAYGFPQGAKRRVKPVALICVHITGNSKLPSALNERNYANRVGSKGPSAHDYIDRDGHIVHAIDTAYAAWSNGDVQSPLANKPGVQTVLNLRARGYNANEAYVREVECVGYGSANPVTDAQLHAIAALIAADSQQWGIAISRSTVHTHAYLNTVTRPSCAFSPASRDQQLDRLVAMAQAIAGNTSHSNMQQQGDPMGLSVRLLATTDATPLDAFGTARIKGTGHSIIRVADRAYQAVADGLDLGTVQKGVLATPLDKVAGDRSNVVVFNNDGQAYVALLTDVAFTALPAPTQPADTTPYSKADLDRYAAKAVSDDRLKAKVTWS